jgi:hypothetical protein
MLTAAAYLALSLVSASIYPKKLFPASCAKRIGCFLKAYKKGDRHLMPVPFLNTE